MLQISIKGNRQIIKQATTAPVKFIMKDIGRIGLSMTTVIATTIKTTLKRLKCNRLIGSEHRESSMVLPTSRLGGNMAKRPKKYVISTISTSHCLKQQLTRVQLHYRSETARAPTTPTASYMNRPINELMPKSLTLLLWFQLVLTKGTMTLCTEQARLATPTTLPMSEVNQCTFVMFMLPDDAAMTNLKTRQSRYMKFGQAPNSDILSIRFMFLMKSRAVRGTNSMIPSHCMLKVSRVIEVFSATLEPAMNIMTEYN